MGLNGWDVVADEWKLVVSDATAVLVDSQVVG